LSDEASFISLDRESVVDLEDISSVEDVRAVIAAYIATKFFDEDPD
jgi:hypothetical protein